MLKLEQPERFRDLDDCWRWLYRFSERLILILDALPEDPEKKLRAMEQELARVREIAEAALQAAGTQ